MTAVTATSTPTSGAQKKLTPIEQVAQALYNAGFRGYPLAIMTAVAGRESSYNPNALNINASSGDYSVGITQINYDANGAGQPIALDQQRVAQYGTPQSLLGNLQAQAKATYDLVGGNSLSGLRNNWALQYTGGNTIPTPVTSTDNAGQAVNYSIAQYLPAATQAAKTVTPGASVGGFQQSNSGVTASGQPTSGPGSSVAPSGLAFLVAYGKAMKLPGGLGIIDLPSDIEPVLVRTGTSLLGVIVALFGLTMLFGPSLVQFAMDSTGLGGLIKTATAKEEAS